MALRLMKMFLKPNDKLLNQFVGAYLCGLIVYEDQLPKGLKVAKKAGVPHTISIWSSATQDASLRDNFMQLSARLEGEPVMTSPMDRIVPPNRPPIRHGGSLGVDKTGEVVLCDGMVTDAYVNEGLLRQAAQQPVHSNGINQFDLLFVSQFHTL